MTKPLNPIDTKNNFTVLFCKTKLMYFCSKIKRLY